VVAFRDTTAIVLGGQERYCERPESPVLWGGTGDRLLIHVRTVMRGVLGLAFLGEPAEMESGELKNNVLEYGVSDRT
jgi:hypothetical protein